jgi:hypothetical protein
MRRVRNPEAEKSMTENRLNVFDVAFELTQL